TVVKAESATSYIHQPKISNFVTGGADGRSIAIRNPPALTQAEKQIDCQLIDPLVGQPFLCQVLAVEIHRLDLRSAFRCEDERHNFERGIDSADLGEQALNLAVIVKLFRL